MTLFDPLRDPDRAERARTTRVHQATVEADYIEKNVAQCVARHGGRFMAMVAADTDRLITAGRMCVERSISWAIKALHSDLRDAKLASTKSGRDVQTFLAHYAAQRHLHDAISARTDHGAGQPWQPLPNRYEYAAAVVARLDRLPPPPPPLPSATSKSKG